MDANHGALVRDSNDMLKIVFLTRVPGVATVVAMRCARAWDRIQRCSRRAYIVEISNKLVQRPIPCSLPTNPIYAWTLLEDGY